MYSSHVLKEGTVLNNKYRIESILGEGGFGIAYRAFDININETVAIKEYFPSTLGTRNVTNSEDMSVTIISDKYLEMYEKGLSRFREEASKLAKFNKEPGIVAVKNYFEENNTGYMVMEFIEGITLKKYLYDRGGKISCDEAIELINPIMDSLSIVHKEFIIHRDISPDNIMITVDGKAKLIDFGAARTYDNEEEKSMSVILKSGYAPIEQYSSNGNQKPATDVYALAATLYRMITGETPMESAARATDNITRIKVPGASGNVASAINKAMQLDVNDRCKSIEEFKELLNKPQRNYFWLYALMIDAAAVILLLMFYKSLQGDVSGAGVEAMQLNNVSLYESSSQEYVREVYACDFASIRNTKTNIYETKTVAHCKTGEVLKCLDENSDYLYVEKEDGVRGYIDAKHALSKEQYDEWVSLYKKALSETGADMYDFESYNLPGYYRDFDGDGVFELFAPVYSGDSGLWYISNGNIVKISDEIPDSYHLFEQGKTSILASRYYSHGKITEEYNYVSSGLPKKLDSKGMLLDDSLEGRLLAIQGEIPGRYEYMTLGGNADTAPIEGEGIWPIVAFNGEIGEYASVEISVDEFEKVCADSPKMQAHVDKLFEQITLEADYVTVKAVDKSLMSVYYNDLGFFTLNYMVYYRLEEGTTNVNDFVMNTLPKQEPWRVIVSFEEGTALQSDFKEMKTAFMGFGTVGTSSGRLPVILTSDFSNFKIHADRK